MFGKDIKKATIIKTEKKYQTYSDKQYEYFLRVEKKSEKITEFSKDFVDISNLHLNFIIKHSLHTKKLSKVLLTYIFCQLYLNIETNHIEKKKFVSWIKKNYYPNLSITVWEEGLEILNELKIIHKDKKENYTFNIQKSYNIKTLLELKKRLPNIYNESVKLTNGLEWINIDLRMMFAYMRDKKVKFEHILYEYLLSIHNKISRIDIEEFWGLTIKQQRKIEEDLNIRKIWNNIKGKEESKLIKKLSKREKTEIKQLNNSYKVNDYIINKIFGSLAKKKKLKKLLQIEKVNKLIADESTISAMKNELIGI